MTNPTTTREIPQLYCPCCGKLTKTDIQVFECRDFYREVIIATCRNKACAVYTRTSSDTRLDSPAELDKFGVTARFDIHTGEAK